MTDFEKFQQKIYTHYLFPKLKEKYPDRDYEYQLNLMWDWWENNKRKKPKSITAFDNWLKYSKPDEQIIAEKKEKQRQELMEEQKKKYFMPFHPTERSIAKLQELKEKFKL